MILRLLLAVIVALVLMIAYRAWSQRQIARQPRQSPASVVAPEQDRLLWLLSVAAIVAAIVLIVLHWRSENAGLWVVISENGNQRELSVESIDFLRQVLVLDDGAELPLNASRELIRALDHRP